MIIKETEQGRKIEIKQNLVGEKNLTQIREKVIGEIPSNDFGKLDKVSKKELSGIQDYRSYKTFIEAAKGHLDNNIYRLNGRLLLNEEIDLFIQVAQNANIFLNKYNMLKHLNKEKFKQEMESFRKKEFLPGNLELFTKVNIDDEKFLDNKTAIFSQELFRQNHSIEEIREILKNLSAFEIDEKYENLLQNRLIKDFPLENHKRLWESNQIIKQTFHNETIFCGLKQAIDDNNKILIKQLNDYIVSNNLQNEYKVYLKYIFLQNQNYLTQKMYLEAKNKNLSSIVGKQMVCENLENFRKNYHYQKQDGTAYSVKQGKINLADHLLDFEKKYKFMDYKEQYLQKYLKPLEEFSNKQKITLKTKNFFNHLIEELKAKLQLNSKRCFEIGENFVLLTEKEKKASIIPGV